jgi:hypothetical protein
LKRPSEAAQAGLAYQENVMVRATTLALALALVPLAATADAQSRNRELDRREVARIQGVPPGQLPPDNQCRVWYDNRASGRQPRPTSCQQAEAIAARERNARVIYGEDAYNRYGRYNDGRYGNGRYGNGTYESYPYPKDRGVYRVPGRNRAPDGSVYPYPNSAGRLGDTAFQNGYRDGREQGSEDGRDNDRFDATRHGRYRSGDRGYIDSYGDKTRYKNEYREGFRAGYEDGYRQRYSR